MNTIKMFAIASLAIFAQSCQKENTADTASGIEVSSSTQTIDAAVESGKTYRLSLPSSASGYNIISAPANASVSAVVNDNGTEVYEYTSTESFTGTENIVLVANDTLDGEGQHGDCKRAKKGNKGQAPAATKQVRQQRVNLNLNVTTPPVAS
jgi:hypothetical protein